MSRHEEFLRRRMVRDGRNPYGSRGGYVVSSRRDRASRMGIDDDDYASYGRGNRDRALRDWREPAYERRSGRYDDMENSIGRPAHILGGEYDRASRYPFMIGGEIGRYDRNYYNPYEEDGCYDYARGRGRDRAYDYARGRGRDRAYGYDYADGDYLSDEELKHWTKRMLAEVEEKDKPMLQKELILKKAEQMGIKFDKFTPEEFYATFLAMFTDYHNTHGSANMDVYIKMAKDFLCDEDAELQYGEKLAAYYYYIVEGE